MTEYIDRTALLDNLPDEPYKGVLRRVLMQAPVADVAPVVHGRWEYDENATDWGIGGYVCSECKNRNNNLPCNRVKAVQIFSGARYCPNCGAKMGGGYE